MGFQHNYSNLRRIRDEDRREGFEEEMSSMHSAQRRTESGDEEEDARPSFGGYNPKPGYDAKVRKRNMEADADTSPKKYRMDNDGNDQPSTSSYGFGMKYLEKFGYEKGTGLGREGTGIVEPIQATGNVKRRGLGDEAGKASLSTNYDDSFFSLGNSY